MVNPASGPRRGEIWWALADKRRPVLVVQADFMNRSQIAWVLCAPMTSNLSLSGMPGNVRVNKQETSLSKTSVINVSQTAALPRFGLNERVCRLPHTQLQKVDEGLRLVLGL